MAKYKGVQYIAQKLAKYYPKKFSGYTAALPEARLVHAQIKDANEKVTVANIKSKISIPRRKIKGAPVLPVLMSEPINYFDLNSYIELISKLPDNLLFKSKLFPFTVDQPIKGGGNYSYEELFKPFVDYCNAMSNQLAESSGEKPDSDSADWYVRCTQPVPHKTKKGIWLSQIISCDSRGNEFDYGFDPKKPAAEVKVPVVSGTEPAAQHEEVPLPESTEKEIPKGPAAGPSVADDRAFLLEMESRKERTAVAETAKIREKMEYIKMLKELGYTPAEIKSELNKL